MRITPRSRPRKYAPVSRETAGGASGRSRRAVDKTGEASVGRRGRERGGDSDDRLRVATTGRRRTGHRPSNFLSILPPRTQSREMDASLLRKRCHVRPSVSHSQIRTRDRRSITLPSFVPRLASSDRRTTTPPATAGNRRPSMLHLRRRRTQASKSAYVLEHCASGRSPAALHPMSPPVSD